MARVLFSPSVRIALIPSCQSIVATEVRIRQIWINSVIGFSTSSCLCLYQHIYLNFLALVVGDHLVIVDETVEEFEY